MIFNDSQREENNDIWVNLYPLLKFFAKHAQVAVKAEGTKEWVRTNRIVVPAVEGYEARSKGN